jgi:sirohydrochlorin ferrochelatase
MVVHGSKHPHAAELVAEVARSLAAEAAGFHAVTHTALSRDGWVEDIDRAAENASEVVVLPCILWPGRHRDDIGAWVESARIRHPDVTFTITRLPGQAKGFSRLLADLAAHENTKES